MNAHGCWFFDQFGCDRKSYLRVLLAEAAEWAVFWLGLGRLAVKFMLGCCSLLLE